MVVAMTPEVGTTKWERTSAARNVACARTRVRASSRNGSFLSFPIIFENATPTNPQKSIPKAIIDRNDHAQVEKVPSPSKCVTDEKKLSCAASEAPDISATTDNTTKKRASAVPSLKRLSPSKMRVSRFGAPSSLKSARTATGSVAEMSVQKRSATTRGISIPKSPRTNWSPKPITSAETTSETTASEATERTLERSSLYPML